MTTDKMDTLDELLDAIPRGSDPAFQTKLKALMNKHKAFEAHPLDQKHDPAWVKEAVALYGDIAAHAKMFRRDPRDNHERTPDEVRELVAHLCRQRGLDAVLEMLMDWRGFKPSALPKDVLATWVRLFSLPEGFFEAKPNDR